MDPLLTRTLRLRPDLTWFRVDPERGLLRAEGESHVVRGHLLVSLVGALNQGPTRLVTLVGTLVRSEAEVYFGLSQLMERSLAHFDDALPPIGLASSGLRTFQFPPLLLDPSPSTPATTRVALEQALSASQLFHWAQVEREAGTEHSPNPPDRSQTGSQAQIDRKSVV